MAGVSIAYELAATMRVVLIEQENQLAYHTTGRSAAMYLQSYGGPIVRALTKASRQDFDRLQDEFDTPQLLTRKPVLWTTDDKHYARLQFMLESIDVLRRVDADEALELCPVLRPDRIVAAAEDSTAMAMDVYAIHAAYVTGIRRRGGWIRAPAHLDALAREGSGWRAVVDREALRVDAVVNAAGAWGDLVADLASEPRVGLQPMRRTIFTSPISALGDTNWPFVCDAAERFYFHAEHDYVLVSPADEIPDLARDVRPKDVDIARTLETVNYHTNLALRSVRNAWAGLRTFTSDRAPVVGMRVKGSGFFWFVGQGGYGIQMAPALARAGASLLVTGRLPNDIAAFDVDSVALSPNRLSVADSNP